MKLMCYCTFLLHCYILLNLLALSSTQHMETRRGKRMKKRLGEAQDNQTSKLTEGPIVTLQQAPPAVLRQPFQEVDDDRNDDSPRERISREALRERLDSILLLLQRLSDRMVAVETTESQQTERIDNVNYRITKLELQGEERKSHLAEMAVAVQHRLQTTDLELERIHGILETLKTANEILENHGVQILNKLEALPKKESEEEDGKESKMKAITAGIYGMKHNVEDMKSQLQSLLKNVTSLNNKTQTLDAKSLSFATKKNLHQTLIEMKDHLQMSSPQCNLWTSTSGQKPEKKKRDPADCWEIQKRGSPAAKSGIYRIQPILSPMPFFVYCDMESDGGGWTVIQRREDGTVDFLREWADYKYGFGNLAGEFWLGNSHIHELTHYEVNELHIELMDFDQQKKTATYSAFAMGSESEGYSLKLLGSYSGNAGDSLRYHVGQKWSTHDVDNDAYPEHNCARDHKGAWWYRTCDTSNLNGQYMHGPLPPELQYQGIYWHEFQGPQYSLWQSAMMIRRGGYVNRTEVFIPLKPTELPRKMNARERTTQSAVPEDYNPEADPYAIFYEYS